LVSSPHHHRDHQQRLFPPVERPGATGGEPTVEHQPAETLLGAQADTLMGAQADTLMGAQANTRT